MLLCILIVIFVSILLIGLYLRYSHGGRLLAKIPGPKGVFLLGSTLDLLVQREDLFKLARDLHFKYGKLSKITGCHIRAVNVFSPEDAEIILSSQRHIEKGISYDFLRPWLGKGLILNDGEKWRERRKMLTPSLHFNILKKFTKVFCEATDEFLNSVKEEAKKDKAEVMPLVMRTTIRIMCARITPGLKSERKIRDGEEELK